MSGKDSDGSQEPWPWNDKDFQRIRAEHERFMKQQREEYNKELVDSTDRNDNAASPSHNSPFSAFKKFIDTNLSALAESVVNLPANLSELRQRMQREQEQRKQEELDISRRWTGSDDTPDHIQLELQRCTQEEKHDAHRLTMMVLSEAARQNAFVPEEKIEVLFHDPQSRFGDLDRFASPMLSLGGACYYMPETGDNLPSTRSWRWTCAPAPRWLSVDWFKRSPYSPIRLEAHPDLGNVGWKWRAAFEDLMNASLDKPMITEERWGFKPTFTHDRRGLQPMDDRRHSTFTGPGLSWMLSLQCRGILPPLIPRHHNDPYGKQETRNRTFTDYFENIQDEIPWSIDSWTTFCSPLYKDFSELRSEIAIKSTWETSSPIPLRVRPETEQDLYECPYLFPPAAAIEIAAEAEADAEEKATDENFIQDIKKMVQVITSTPEDQHADELTDMMLAFHHKYQDYIEMFKNRFEESQQHPPVTGIISPTYAFQNNLHKAYNTPEDEEYRKYLSKLNERFALRQMWIRMFYDELPKIINGTEPADEVLESYFKDFMRDVDSLSSSPSTERRNETFGFSPEQVEEQRQQQELQFLTKPDVLSALTTTQTTRLPDGTVTTKVVLKQRFADGREETHESVHTSHESVEQQQQSTQDVEKKFKQQKGWFWS